MLALFEMLYPNKHPYGRPAKGNVDSVNSHRAAATLSPFITIVLRRR